MSSDVITTSDYTGVDSTSTGNWTTPAGGEFPAVYWANTTSTTALSDAVFEVALMIIGTVGSAANVIVLVGLLFYGELGKNTMNVLIGNQTIMDTVACFAMMVTTVSL